MQCSKNTKLKTPTSNGQDYDRQYEATQRSKEEQTIKSAERKKKNIDCSSGSGQQQQKGSSYYLIKPICLVVFLVLLISQLKAIELPIKKSIPVAVKTVNIVKEKVSETNNNNPRRFDNELVSLIHQDNEQTIRSHDTGADSTNDNVEPLEVASTVSQIAINTSPNRVARSENSNQNDNNTEMSVNGSLVDAQTVLPPSTTGLAEATAAGTAVGLLFHDLMTQANMQLDRNQAYQQPDMYNGLQSIGREMAQTDEGADSKGDEDGSNNDEDDSDGQTARNGLFYNRAHIPNRLNSMNRPEMLRVSADERGNTLSPSSESGEVPDARSSFLAADGVPLSEEQMPDSMESLMKSEGENYTDDGGDDGQQSASDSNLVNQPNSISNNILPRLPAFQYDGVTNEVKNGYEQEDDDDEEQGESLLVSPNTNRELSVPPQIAAMASKMHQGYPIGMPLIENEANFLEPQATNGHHLIPSIRDSQIDLNTAAGHYYGKKKKKVKKKKKKKKKKYKKVKIVKKYKKKPKKKKKMVHHDHGKYYMYAKVPKKKSWEFGFKKGNKKHWIERHEKGHKNKFKTKVKWYDKKSKGKGVHIWDYNHHDKKKKKHH